MANGATWLSTTRERASIRRSLPATRSASRHMDVSDDERPVRPATCHTTSQRTLMDDPPPAIDTTRSAKGRDASGSWEASSTVAPSATASVMTRPAGPGPRRRGRRGVRRATTGRGDGRRGRPGPPVGVGRPRDAPPACAGSRPTSPGDRGPRRCRRRRPRRPGRRSGCSPPRQLVVESGRMPEHPHLAADGRGVAPEVMAENHGLAGGHRQQAGAGPQNRRLARPVGSLRERRSRRGDGEVDAGQGGEPPGQSDSGTEGDCGSHGLGPCYGGPAPESKRGGNGPPAAGGSVQLTVSRPRPTADPGRGSPPRTTSGGCR
jgi:hypothetical protein